MSATFTFCRHKACRLKLKPQAASRMAAFCCRGCWAAYYNTHCRVCDTAMRRRTRGVNLCGSECRRSYARSGAAWREYRPEPAKSCLAADDMVLPEHRQRSACGTGTFSRDISGSAFLRPACEGCG